MVLASLFTSGRDEANFPDASDFQPSRWIRNANGKLSAVHRASASVPFALGSRSCVGQKLANIQMHFLISTVSFICVKYFENHNILYSISTFLFYF